MRTTIRDVGRRVAELREARGWTQEGLAARMRSAGSEGYSRRALQAIEAGAADPPLTRLMELARALGVEVTDLFQPPSTRARRQRGRPVRAH